MRNLIEIQFDGGCRGNPGAKYGSFAVWHTIERCPRHLLVKTLRLPFGHGTNNEAEFEACIAGLDWTNNALDVGGFFHKDFSARVYTDSTVVGFRLNRANASNKTEPEKRMAALAEKCLSTLIKFRIYEVDFISRDKNVALFGH